MLDRLFTSILEWFPKPHLEFWNSGVLEALKIHNQKEKEHRMRETRFAQIDAALLILGFSVQIVANVIYES